MAITNELLQWYKKYGRDLPWRHTSNPYIIWLSEIILQQTRVEQGTPYFYRFIEEFPNIKVFAEAGEEAILRQWQGLGYYSRARNMYKASLMVMSQFAGVFPSKYDDVIKLPGVGQYTAAAISSFAKNERKAVVDGNVFRVLSRYFGISTPINSSAGIKEFTHLAGELISDREPGMYNHAIMDFGATVCKPKLPDCENCVLREGCVAYHTNTIAELPVKLKGKPSRTRYFHYIVVERNGELLMSKRAQGDVWANMYEFPLIESEKDLSLEVLMALPEYQQYFGGGKITQISPSIKHVLSHQNIYAKFYKFWDDVSLVEKKLGWNYYNSDNLDKLAKHKLIFSFLNKYFIN